MGSKCPHMGRCAIQTDNPYSTTHDNKMLINTYDRILTLQGPKPSRHKKAAGRQDTCDTYVRALNVSPPPQQTIITRLMFRECRSCRYCRKVVHISGASMLVQAVSITRCALPFCGRQSCRHCRSAETYIRQMLVQRYNSSNHTFTASADRSCRHGRNAARVLTRTRILVQKYRVLCPGMRFFCRSTITGAVDLVEAQSRKHVV